MNKNEYVAPLLTVVEFKTERGYAGSAEAFGFLGLSDLFADSGDEYVESRGDGGSWAGNDW